jgi:hypothetical protein
MARRNVAFVINKSAIRPEVSTSARRYALLGPSFLKNTCQQVTRTRLKPRASARLNKLQHRFKGDFGKAKGIRL